MKTLRKFLALAAAIASITQLAHAVPQLRIFDGTTTITIDDNGVGDSQGAAGQVVWIGSIGNWTLNVHTGTTWPVIGTLASPFLDLSFNATSTAAGTLEILFSADGFGPTNAAVTAGIGGTVAPVAGGSLTYSTYGGTDNVNFSTANLLTSQGPFGSGPFSDSATGGPISNGGPYALTQVVAITHGAGTSITTGDASLTAVPESGTSILLLGAGLTCVGLLARFRRRLA